VLPAGSGIERDRDTAQAHAASIGCAPINNIAGRSDRGDNGGLGLHG
jgi:hypothetical protein